MDHKEMQGEGHVTIEAEVGAMAATRSQERGMGQILPRSLWKEPTRTPRSWASSLPNREKNVYSCKPPGLWYLLWQT